MRNDAKNAHSDGNALFTDLRLYLHILKYSHLLSLIYLQMLISSSKKCVIVAPTQTDIVRANSQLKLMGQMGHAFAVAF